MLNTQEKTTYASLFAPRYPPSPMEIAPAMSSANPPYMTTLVFPKADRPAVRAKGTVRPSDNPIVASEITRASTLKPFLEFAFSVLESILCDSISLFSESIEAVCCTPVADCAVSSGIDRLEDRSCPLKTRPSKRGHGKHGRYRNAEHTNIARRLRTD
jgi:hypothetical protein